MPDFKGYRARNGPQRVQRGERHEEGDQSWPASEGSRGGDGRVGSSIGEKSFRVCNHCCTMSQLLNAMPRQQPTDPSSPIAALHQQAKISRTKAPWNKNTASCASHGRRSAELLCQRHRQRRSLDAPQPRGHEARRIAAKRAQRRYGETKRRKRDDFKSSLYLKNIEWVKSRSRDLQEIVRIT